MDEWAVGEEQDAFDEVFELTDVARPGVGLQDGQRVCVEPFDLLVQSSVVFLQEMSDQGRDVLRPVAQWR